MLSPICSLISLKMNSLCSKDCALSVFSERTHSIVNTAPLFLSLLVPWAHRVVSRSLCISRPLNPCRVTGVLEDGDLNKHWSWLTCFHGPSALWVGFLQSGLWVSYACMLTFKLPEVQKLLTDRLCPPYHVLSLDMDCHCHDTLSFEIPFIFSQSLAALWCLILNPCKSEHPRT